MLYKKRLPIWSSRIVARMCWRLLLAIEKIAKTENDRTIPEVDQKVKSFLDTAGDVQTDVGN
jgi:hypothetical protein